ncbi:MAG: DUF2924 domain-containing protein [Betaproteobacteria bacterium]|nr:DUF2924 domain-containing protein [Betaproteobacteria bacterium]
MHAIDVDFDVFKAITMRRSSEDVTANDVLRQLLGLPSKKEPTVPSSRPEIGDWITKGVRFPAGTEFRANYKGQTWLGRVDGGALLMNGKRYDSPSSAAVSITANPVNGWTFWECRLPGQPGWKIIKALRKLAA